MKKIAMNKKIKRDRSERSNGSDKKIKGSDRLTKNGELNEEKSSQQLVSLMSYQCQRNDKSGVGLNFNCPNPLTWWIPSFIFSEIAIFLALISLPLQSSAKSAKTIGWKSPSIARLDEGTPLAVRELRPPPPPPASHQLNETEPPEGTVKSEICHNTWDDCSDGPCCVCGEDHDFAEHCPYFCEIPPGKIPLRGFQVVCCYCRTPMCYLIGRYVKEFQGKEPHGKPCVRGKKCWFCKDSGHMHGLCPGRVKEILPELEGDQYELPKLRPVASTDVVVTNLTPKVTEYDLFRHFGRLGANGMRSVDVDKIEGKHYGHLEFRNLEYASLAIQKANVSTTTLDGQRIKCHIVKLPHLSVNWDAF